MHRTIGTLLCAILSNRYRAFRRARDVRCTLYVICCKTCTIGQVYAILGVSWEDVVAMSGPSWGHFGKSSRLLGSTLGLDHET